jgi:hypothetical protein
VPGRNSDHSPYISQNLKADQLWRMSTPNATSRWESSQPLLLAHRHHCRTHDLQLLIRRLRVRNDNIATDHRCVSRQCQHLLEFLLLARSRRFAPHDPPATHNMIGLGCPSQHSNGIFLQSPLLPFPLSVFLRIPSPRHSPQTPSHPHSSYSVLDPAPTPPHPHPESTTLPSAPALLADCNSARWFGVPCSVARRTWLGARPARRPCC